MIKATFYMKSGNSFTLEFDELTFDGSRVKWSGADYKEQLHYIDPNEIEALTYHIEGNDNDSERTQGIT